MGWNWWWRGALAAALSVPALSVGAPAALPLPSLSSSNVAASTLGYSVRLAISKEASTNMSPLLPAITGNQPYTDVTSHPGEYNEAKGALQWQGEIKFVVAEARGEGLLRQDEVALWQNVLLGMVGVESVGRNFSLAAATGNWYSQGLTQLVYAHLYREENPYDPLTNLRTGLRTVLRYYRMHGNRWDWAVAQHVTGAEDELRARDARDWNGTSGLDYAKRVVNIVWQADRLHNSRDVYPAKYYRYQAQGNGGFDKAPLWDIFDSPRLSYNWSAPSTSTAGYYQSRGADTRIADAISKNTWFAAPIWFYGASPANDLPAYQPRQPTASESSANPPGRTLNAPRQETYPRQQWSAP